MAKPRVAVLVLLLGCALVAGRIAAQIAGTPVLGRRGMVTFVVAGGDARRRRDPESRRQRGGRRGRRGLRARGHAPGGGQPRRRRLRRDAPRRRHRSRARLPRDGARGDRPRSIPRREGEAGHAALGRRRTRGGRSGLGGGPLRDRPPLRDPAAREAGRPRDRARARRLRPSAGAPAHISPAARRASCSARSPRASACSSTPRPRSRPTRPSANPISRRRSRSSRRAGPDVFYRGEIADQIVAAVEAAGGVMTKEDLAAYRVKDRRPLVGKYRDATIITMPPPSSGGVAVLEALGVLEEFPIRDLKFGSEAATHILAETLRRVFKDRSVWMGDPDFSFVPVRTLVSRPYAKLVARQIRDDATPSDTIELPDPIAQMRHEQEETTHFSVVDARGNAVALTTTLNGSFGSGVTVDGRGIPAEQRDRRLHDRARASRTCTGSSRASATSSGAGKRPLSSMTPTIVVTKNDARAPGRRKPRRADDHLDRAPDHRQRPRSPDDGSQAVAAPRIHHQWMPGSSRRRAVRARARRDRRTSRARPRDLGSRQSGAAGVPGRRPGDRPPRRRLGGRGGSAARRARRWGIEALTSPSRGESSSRRGRRTCSGRTSRRRRRTSRRSAEARSGGSR